MDVPYEYFQTRAYDIYKGGMNLYDQVNSYGEKYVFGSWLTFIYLCIPEFYLSAACGCSFEVAIAVAWLHMVPLK
jgi:hypothetical protein